MPKNTNKGERKQKKQKDPNKPKKPQTPYFLYLADNRERIKQQYPEAKVTEIAKIASEEWKTINSEAKAYYTQKHDEAKEIYQKQMEEYQQQKNEYQQQQETNLAQQNNNANNYNNGYNSNGYYGYGYPDDYYNSMYGYQMNYPTYSSYSMNHQNINTMHSMQHQVHQSNASMNTSATNTNTKHTQPKQKKVKDPNKPKKPQTPYFLYLADNRERIQMEHPEAKVTDIAKYASEEWKTLSPDAKAYYTQKHEEAKVVHQKLMEEYEANKANQNNQQNYMP